MASRNIYNQNSYVNCQGLTLTINRGFTLIEIIIVMAIMIFVVGFGLTVDFSSFTTNTLKGEESKIVSVLERARSHAMANMFDINYGVCYDRDAQNYLIFKGGTCTTIESEFIPANINIAQNSGTSFPTFVFDRLTGDTTAGTIHITDGIQSADIIINNEGTINW